MRTYKTISKYNNIIDNDNGLIIKKTRSDVKNTVNPQVWGPSLWLFLHITSVNYVYSKESSKMMKNFIIALPYTLPCNDCSEHARKYIKDSLNILDNVCSSRNNLFKFFVDFHNYVNQRHNKPIFSYQEAWNMYSEGVNILDFSFCS